MCGKRGKLFATALAGPFTDSLAPADTSSANEKESRAGAGTAGGERGHGETLAFSSLANLVEAAPSALGSGLNPSLASHDPGSSLLPVSPPRDPPLHLQRGSPLEARRERAAGTPVAAAELRRGSDLSLHLPSNVEQGIRTIRFSASQTCFSFLARGHEETVYSSPQDSK